MKVFNNVYNDNCYNFRKTVHFMTNGFSGNGYNFDILCFYNEYFAFD